MRLNAAKQQLEQGSLAASIRPDDADFVAAPEGRAKILYDRRATIAEADIFSLNHFLSGCSALLQFDLCRSGAFAPLAPLGAQGFEGADAALVPGAPGLHSLPEPCLLLSEFFIECGPLFFLGLERRPLAFQIRIVVARPAGEVSPVEFDDAGGEFP